MGDVFVFDRLYAAAALQSAAADAGLGAVTSVVHTNWNGYKPCAFNALRSSTIKRVLVCSGGAVCSGAFAVKAEEHYQAANINLGHEWPKANLELLLNFHPSEAVKVINPEDKVVTNGKPESKSGIYIKHKTRGRSTVQYIEGFQT